MRKRYLLYPFIFILVLSLGGCATIYNPATGRQEFIIIDTQAEIAIGKSVVSQISVRYKLSEDKQEKERLERIGQRIAGVSDRQDLKYSFDIIEDKTLNAFTVPGGHIYIYRGLYELLDDDELACVFGHEIGHIVCRHIVKKLQASLGYQMLSTIVLDRYLKTHKEKRKKVAYTAYAASTVFNLVMLGYSREDEYQADELALKYTYKAAFRPEGMIAVLKKLKTEQDKGFKVPYILRSHPYIDERIARIEEKINAMARLKAFL